MKLSNVEKTNINITCWLNICAEVGFNNIFGPLSCEYLLGVEHGIKRVPRVTMLLKHSISKLGPFIEKHLARWTKD